MGNRPVLAGNHLSPFTWLASSISSLPLGIANCIVHGECHFHLSGFKVIPGSTRSYPKPRASKGGPTILGVSLYDLTEVKMASKLRDDDIS